MSLIIAAPRLDRDACDFRPPRVDRDWHLQPLADPREHRRHARELDFDWHFHRADWTRGLSTNVDHVGARSFHRERVLDGAIGVKVSATIGERIGRNVEHAHHRGKFDYAAVGQLET